MEKKFTFGQKVTIGIGSYKGPAKVVGFGSANPGVTTYIVFIEDEIECEHLGRTCAFLVPEVYLTPIEEEPAAALEG